MIIPPGTVTSGIAYTSNTIVRSSKETTGLISTADVLTTRVLTTTAVIAGGLTTVGGSTTVGGLITVGAMDADPTTTGATNVGRDMTAGFTGVGFNSILINLLYKKGRVALFLHPTYKTRYL